MEDFEELLVEFKKLPDRIERPPTFMEISGYPHYENVCSNILAFFMDPEEPHGFGTLVLDALVGAANIAADEGLDSNISVEREVSTEAGNRIDILIESDAQAILIENKIYAGATNPFDDYADYLDRIAAGRAKHKILLTVFPTSEGSECGFANLTYDEFIYAIRAKLGYFVAKVDTRYLTMFLDFLNTLDSLQKGTRMDQEFIKFLSEREDDTETLFAELIRFKNELRTKVRELNALIELEEHENVVQGFYREKTRLFDDTLYNVRVSEDLLVSIDVIINPRGWRIFIWPREGDRLELASLLEHLEIPSQEGNLLIPSTQDRRFVYTTRFAYDENLDRIRPVLQDVVDKLATSREYQK